MEKVRFTGRGRTVREAFANLCEGFSYNEGAFMVKLRDEWEVAIDVIPPTQEQQEQWEEDRKKLNQIWS